MRDVATLVWVILIIVGVVSSMISSVRRQRQAMPMRTAPRQPPSPIAQAPGSPQPPAVSPRPAAPRPIPPNETTAPVHGPAVRPSRRLFATKPDVIKAIIAAEVLGKPKALRGEDFPV